ncbi:MAG: tyrosine-type recombinase/integrase [Treponema sp.]|nr:tyrosine-type recombinase/integrase [Treponema sp.]MCL2273260.1 tyrosine-type recombinase/integrase [Treponema sp.]
MRIKAAFSVFKRKLPSGRSVFYYQCYDQKGKRQWAKSTGSSKKTEAIAYCMQLYKEGKLIPEQKVPTFGEYAKGWWNPETCRYLKWRQLHEPITMSTLHIHQCNFRHHIKDYFSKYRLDEISPHIIEGWLLFMSEKGSNKKQDFGKKEKKLKGKTINMVLGTLRLMFAEAVRNKVIRDNPCNAVKELKEEKIVRTILTVEEARKLFPVNWQALWENPIAYKAHKLAACTGIRIGELRGLKGENVFDDYILISGQYTRYGYVQQTKTKDNRCIPIPSLMREELDVLLRSNGNGYVFSSDGGNNPMSIKLINKYFINALNKIGISYNEKLERNLSFHSWRHFLNTLLRMSNIADSKVQSITGHRSINMTNHYTHFDTRKFGEVRDVQQSLLVTAAIS